MNMETNWENKFDDYFKNHFYANNEADKIAAQTLGAWYESHLDRVKDFIREMNDMIVPFDKELAGDGAMVMVGTYSGRPIMYASTDNISTRELVEIIRRASSLIT